MENSGLKKVRIFWDCLFPACQGLKIGINRQPLSLFYKLSKRNESKVRRLPASELYEGEIVVYQLSELKYKGKMWINYDEKIKEEGKI